MEKKAVASTVLVMLFLVSMLDAKIISGSIKPTTLALTRSKAQISAFNGVLSSGDSWPLFHKDSRHTGYSDSTPTDSLKLEWSYQISEDDIAGSPTVDYGRIYCTGWVYNTTNDYPPNDRNGAVYCLDESGRLVWKFRAFGGQLGTPGLANGRVFVFDDFGHGYCLDAYTGSVCWNITLGFAGAELMGPTIVDSKIFVEGGLDFCPNGTVGCLDEFSGLLLWKFNTGGGAEFSTSPAVANGRVYAAANDSKIYCLDENSGALIWKYTAAGPNVRPPTVVDSRVIFGSVGGFVYCLDEWTGAELWRYSVGAEVRSCPAVAQGRVYFGANDGRVYCLNEWTGAFIWSCLTGGPVRSSPALAQDRIVVGCEDGKIYLINAETGACLWTYQTGGQTYSSPAIVGSRVYTASEDCKIYCFSFSFPITFTESGLPQGEQWSVTLDGQTKTSTVWSTIDKMTFYVVTTGTCDFSISANPLYFCYPTAQGVINAGDSPDVAIRFTIVTVQPIIVYAVGLPAGSIWSATCENITQYSSASNPISFTFEDGIHRFSFSSTGYSVQPSPVVVPAETSTDVIFIPNSNPSYFTSWNPLSDSYSIDSIAQGSSEGYCYGFSTTALLYFMHYTHHDNTYPYFPAQTYPASHTSDLVVSYSSTLTAASLAYFFHQVYDPRNTILITLLLSNGRIDEGIQWDTLSAHLAMGTPVVLSMAGFTDHFEGHSVVAWGMARLKSGVYAIAVYDPARPYSTQVALYDPISNVFIFILPTEKGNIAFTWFMVLDPTEISISTSWFPLPGFPNGPPRSWWWLNDWLTLSSNGYSIVLANKMVKISSNGLEDYFTASGNSETFVEQIPGSSGIEEQNVQVYAIPKGIPFTISDPGSSQSSILITHVDNESGQLAGYGCFLNATTSHGSLNFTAIPSNSGLYIVTGDNALNASVTFFSATQQSYSASQTSNVQVDAMQTFNFTRPPVSYVMTAIPSRRIVGQGYNAGINLTVANIGSSAEAFNFTVCANDTVIGTFANMTLPGNSITTIPVGWNTTGFAYGNYVLSAYLEPVSGTSAANVNCTGCTMLVTIPGDVDGSFDVTILDVVKITGIYASKLGDLNFNPNSDINDDDQITILDVVICTGHYGQKRP